MGTYRVVWQFIAPGGAPWNEVYYTDGGSPAEATVISTQLRGNRLALLNGGCTWLRIRASDVSNSRLTALRKIMLPGTATSEGEPDTAGNTAYCTLATAGGVQRKLALRGLPDNWIIKGGFAGNDTPPPEFLKALDAFFLNLARTQYGIRHISPVGAGLLAARQILSVDGTITPGVATLTLDVAAAYPVPGRILISNASPKDFPGLNGHWSVRSVNGATVVIPYQTVLGLKIPGGRAQVRQEVYSATLVFQASSCEFAYYGVRKTKDLFTSSRGARRAVRLRTSL